MNEKKTTTKRIRVVRPEWNVIAFILFIAFAANKVSAQCSQISINTITPAICEGNPAKFMVGNYPSGSQLSWILNKHTGNTKTPIDTIKESNQDSVSFLILKAGKYSAQLEIVFPDGKSCIISNEQTVSVGSAPSETPITVSHSKVCALPATVEFKTSPSANNSFDWIVQSNDGDVYTNAGNVIIHEFTSNGYKNVVLRVRNAQGCESSFVMDSIVYAFNMNSPDFGLNELSIKCDEKVISPQPIFTPDSNVSVEWTFSGGTPFKSTELFPTNVTYNKEGSYTVKLKMTSEGGCTDEVSKENAIVVGTGVRPNIAISKTEVCTGTEVLFTDKTTKPEGGSVQWVFPGGTVNEEKSNPKTQVVNYTSAGTYGVYFKYEKGGCTSDTLLADTMKVRSLIPAFSMSYACNCQPGLVEFTNKTTSTQTGENLKYTWSIFNQNKELLFRRNDENPSYNFKKMGLYTVELEVTNELGCSKSTQQVINFSPLQAAFSVSSKLTCLGEEVSTNINKAKTCETGLKNIIWLFYDLDGKTILDRQKRNSGKYAYSKPGVYDIALIVLNDSGCTDTLKIEKAVEIFKLKASFKISETEVCIGDKIDVELVHKPIPANAANTWRIIDQKTGARVTSTDANFSFSFDEAGIYSLELISQKSAQCADSVSAQNLFKVSGTKFKISSITQEACLPLQDQIEAQLVYNVHHNNPSSSIKYTWTSNTENGIAIADPAAKKTTVSINKSGLYDLNLKAENADGCITQVNSKDFYQAGVVAQFTAPTIACTNIPFTIQNESYVNPTQYLWTSSDSLLQFQPSANDLAPTTVFSQAGDYTISLVAKNKLGCTDSSFQQIKVIDFDFSFESKDTIGLCSPAFVTFSTNSTNVDYFVWDFGDGQTLTTKKDTVAHLYDIQGLDLNDNSTFSVKVTAISKHGCEKVIIKKDYITVWGPQPKFIMKNNIATGKADVEFIDLSKNVSRFYINFDDQSSIDSSFNTHTYELLRKNQELNVYKPFMVAFDDRNCKAIYPRPFEGDSVIIYNGAVPAFSVDTTEQCNNASFQFYNESRFADSFEWFLNDADSVFSNEINPSIELPVGIHSIKLVAYNKNADKRAEIKNNYINVHATPQVKIALQDSFTCRNTDVVFLDQSYSENEITAWEWTINNQVYTEKNPVCAFAEYGDYDVLLKVSDAKNCASERNFGKFIKVDEPSEITHRGIDYLTINDRNRVEVNFSDANSKGVSQFLLYNEESGVEKLITPIGLVGDAQLVAGSYEYYNTTDTRYQLRAIDQCKDTVALGNWHRPLSLEIYTPKLSGNGDDNNYFPRISWDEYEGWNEVDHYEIWRAVYGREAKKVASVPGNKNNFLDSFVCSDVYQYQVKAIHPTNAWTSASPSDTTKPNYVAPTGAVNLFTTTVEDEKVITSWNAHKHPKIEKYIITRKDLLFGDISMYGSTSDTFFNDSDVLIHSQVYQYEVSAVDYCQNQTDISSTGNSIVLSPRRNEDNVELTWNTFKNWEGEATYYVERKVGSEDYQVIFTTKNDTSFKDEDIFKTEEEAFYYRVRAVNGNKTSMSNMVKHLPDVRIFFPNAFSPNGDGINDEFYVVGSGAQNGGNEDFDNFNLTIVNRWGETIFESTDINEGWNGTYKNSPSPIGTYVYRVHLRDAQGRFYYHSGNVTLLN